MVRPLVSISMGDPAGIGPEVTMKALAVPEIYRHARPIVIGKSDILADAARICGLSLRVDSVEPPFEGIEERPGTVHVFETGELSLSNLCRSTATPESGAAAFAYVAKGIELAMAHQVHATVTGPINKAALNAAGFHYSGHTEIYADFTKTRDYCMMLADGAFRVSHVSTHVPLREACDRVKKDRILKVIDLTVSAIKKMGVVCPRIAVAGLNPHCSEGGLFGWEEAKEIIPAVEEARAHGLRVEGPIPPDSVFPKMAGGMYDAVVVMYHDQGHIPTKLHGFHYEHSTGTWSQLSGVNITLGLPIIRVSVDHGTAFDQAGRGTANPESMINSILLAAQLAR